MQCRQLYSRIQQQKQIRTNTNTNSKVGKVNQSLINGVQR